LQARREEAERQAKKNELEFQAHREEAQRLAQKEDSERQERVWKMKADEHEREERYRSNAARAKHFGDAMRNALVRMADDPVDAIPFFESVERLFDTLKVPDNLKTDFLRPYLSP
jgi:hypothetical protein